MRGKRFTEKQIIGILKEGEAGVPTKNLCCHHGIAEQTSTAGGASTGASTRWN